MSSSSLRVIVGGELAGVPYQGGASWAVLQYVLGLRDLGHNVLVVETVEPDALDDPDVLTYFHALVDRFDLAGGALLIGRGTRRTVAIPYERFLAEARRADLLLNLSGRVTDQAILDAVPLRVYVDLDPAFTQLWHAACGIDVGLAGHDKFVTVGLAVGTPGCSVPTCGVEWIPTPPPVCLDRWHVDEALVHDALTTVANWRGYGSIEHEGVFHGQKAHSLRDLIALPARTSESFVLALSIDPGETKDLQALHAGGWQLVGPEAFPRTPTDYQRFIQGSKGEFGLAKSGYVVSGSGWFSDRSACYLASGRPVVAQDTGFSNVLPCGQGLLAFDDLDGAVEAVENLRYAYESHRKAARDLAEAHLDAATVLPALIESVGTTF